MKKLSLLLLLTSLFLTGLCFHGLSSEGEQAWNALKTYQFGDELVPLIAIESEVRLASGSSETQSKMAAKLASFLNDETTYAGRQFICLQLRFIGTTAEVPILATYLNRPEDSDNARMALQSIDGEEALIPLRKALETFKGEALTGVIASLAHRNDTVSIPALIRWCDSDNPAVASAALAALGTFDTNESVKALMKPRESAAMEKTRWESLLRIGFARLESGNTATAKEIFSTLSDQNLPKNIRYAALEGTLRTFQDKEQNALLSQWFLDDDTVKNTIAASRLKQLSSAQFDALFARIAEMNPQGKAVFLELAAEQQNEKVITYLQKSLETGTASERLSALRALGLLGNPEFIPLLIELLKDPALQEEVADALKQFSKEIIGPPLIRVLEQAELRNKALDILSGIKCYDAIDPLIVMAQSAEITVFIPVIAALGKICDPDDSDIPRMLKLYSASRPGVHREHVERAIVVICEKFPDPATRADIVLRHLRMEHGELPRDDFVTMIPLLGKLGNWRVAELLFPYLTCDQPDLQHSAMRGLCNWPNAEYIDKLWDIAANNPSPLYAQWGLRAYIRVATLRSDRPESETLAMLQRAMKLAKDVSDKRWCISRAATIRTMETVEWTAGYLDDPELAQSACVTIAELARHRFLREPNKERFEPILLKVEKTAEDSGVIERARRSRLGM